jgi:hypothetical protein
VFVLPRFDLCHVLSPSTNNFAHAQTLSRMSSLSGRMNIARVNIGFFTGFNKIKQRRISVVLGYLRMILTSILKSWIFQICAAIYKLLLHMVFASRNFFAMQGPVAIILISWNVIFIWETDYWTSAIKRFALFDLLKSLYSDTKILSKYILSLQRR